MGTQVRKEKFFPLLEINIIIPIACEGDPWNRYT